MYIRVLKRRTSLEVSAEDFYEIELRTKSGGPDLNLSSYCCTLTFIPPQTYSEHCADVGLDPPGPGILIDVEQALRHLPRSDPRSNGYFKTTASTHHTCEIESADELRGLAGLAVEGKLNSFRIAKVEIKEYVQSRLNGGDVEWRMFLSSSAKGRKWVSSYKLTV